MGKGHNILLSVKNCEPAAATTGFPSPKGQVRLSLFRS